MRRRPYRNTILTVLFLMVAAPLLAAEPEGITKIRTIEGITEYSLSNGMHVLLFPDESKQKVTVNLTLFVGSRHEGYGEAGMAHLLEHMLFKGTPTHPQVPKSLTERGADFNGTTWLDRTNYFETLPATEDNLEFAIKLEADRMMNSYIKKEDLASEMTVVRNEFERGENTPAYILSQRMEAVAFEWHNYGKSTIGNRADIERVPVERLKVFYQKYYQPDNAMLIVAGRFDPEKALALIQQTFGAIPRPKRVLDNTYTEEPPQDGERFVNLRRVGDVAIVGALYHICSGAHPDFASLYVLDDILTGAPGGRLYKALVETKKASRVSGETYALHDPGMTRFSAEVAKGNDPPLVLENMLEVIDQVPEKGVTAEEVERSVRKILTQRERDEADTGNVAIELSEWAAQGDWRLYFLFRDRVEKVTPESVKEVATKYLKQSNRTVGIYYPTAKPDQTEVPATPELTAMIGDYKGRDSGSQGEAFDSSPSNIESRTKRFELPGGIKAAFLKKATRNEAVNLRLTLRYGSEKSLKNLTSACEFLPDLMSRGTKSMNRQQIQDALDKEHAQLQATGSAAEATFVIETRKANLPAVLEILRQVLREPTLPKSELELLQQSQISALDEARTDPNELAQRATRRALYPYAKDDVRYIPTLEEEIEMVQSLSAEGMQKFYQDFLNGENGELTVVGDFDDEAIMPALHKAFEGWKSPTPYERLRYLVIPGVKGQSIEIPTPGKANATYFASEAIPLADTNEDYPALVIGNFVLGGGSLSSRLADRIRQRDGLSYGVGSGFQSRSLDPRSAFYVYAICNPVNMTKVKAAVLEEINRLLKDGVTEKEVQMAIEGYLKGLEVDFATDDRLAYTLSETTEAGRTMDYYTDLEQKIRALKPQQIVDAMRKHIDPQRMVVTAAGDFAAAGKDKAPAAKSAKK